jgi:hypothetical protein
MAEAKTPAKKAVANPAAKPTVKKPIAKKPVVKKPAAPASKKVVAAPGAEERYKMVEVAAYFIAERNGFAGDPSAFWAEAEMQISKLLKF